VSRLRSGVIRPAAALLLAAGVVALLALIWLQGARVASAQSGVPCSPAYRIDETLPTGARWEMCWEPRLLEGIVLHDITFTPPNGPRRLVLASASLAQVHVPYDDNGARFHDITDFGFGGIYLASLSPEECPDGRLLTHGSKRAVCLQTRNRGLAQRYYARTLQGYEMSLFSVSMSGDYNYIVQWVFKDDGTIEPVVGAAGQLQRYGADPQYGWRTGPGPVPISHFHNYWWRLDFDIDGMENDRVEEIQFESTDGGRRRTLSVSPFALEAARTHNPAQQRSWRVLDTQTRNGDGAPISYQIEGLSSGHDFVGPTFEPFAQHDLYVTRARPCERFPSHNPTLGGCGDDVTDFVNGEDVDGADVVLWYGITFHHLPRAEDETWMDVHWDGFTIVPRDWTASNPLDTRTDGGQPTATATPTATPPATVAPTATPELPATGCVDLLVNGGFEGGAAWAVGNTPFPAGYVVDPVHAGARAMRTGLPAGAANRLAYSSFFQQVNLPAAAEQIVLQYWERVQGPGDGVDLRETLLLNSRFGLLRTLERSTAAGDETWRLRRFDVTAQRGQEAILYLNVYNNGGAGQLSAVYDDIVLLACSRTGGLPGGGAQALAVAPGQVVLDVRDLPQTVELLVTSPAGAAVAWQGVADVPWLRLEESTGSTPGTVRVNVVAPPGDSPISNGNVLLSGVEESTAASAVQFVVLRGMDERQYLPSIQRDAP
jgi:hypothetical protein